MNDDVLTAVETAVLAVPGVAELYHARPTLTGTLETAKRLATRTALARVVLDDDVLRVVIGTDGEHPAPETARRAHLAALAVAEAHGLVLSRVDVRVARVG
jgi:hypothetical protein